MKSLALFLGLALSGAGSIILVRAFSVWCLLFLVGAGWLWVGCFVNCIVDVSVFVDAFFEFLNLFCFWFVLVLLVAMGVRWMSWHKWLMKDVAACVIPWGVGERALIWGFPNGVT